MTALTPRVIGETVRAQTGKAARSDLPAIGREDWINENLAKFGAATVQAAHAYIRLVEDAGAHAEVTRAQGSIICVFDLSTDIIYPLTLSKYGKGLVQLCLNYLVNRSAFRRKMSVEISMVDSSRLLAL